MSMDFHSQDNKHSYSTREAGSAWLNEAAVITAGQSIDHAVDIGCGGGIYSRALQALSIPKVTGIDFSKPMIAEAEAHSTSCPGVHFQTGSAYQTNLPDDDADLVLLRAVTHHLSDIHICFSEASRILKPGGFFIVQDRTPEDCFVSGSPTHIRGWLMEFFPQLALQEKKRRHSRSYLSDNMKETGFSSIETRSLWETRKEYNTPEALFEDLRGRTGRSILHEVSDGEIERFITFLSSKLPPEEKIIEKDRWTIWIGRR